MAKTVKKPSVRIVEAFDADGNSLISDYPAAQAAPVPAQMSDDEFNAGIAQLRAIKQQGKTPTPQQKELAARLKAESALRSAAPTVAETETAEYPAELTKQVGEQTWMGNPKPTNLESMARVGSDIAGAAVEFAGPRVLAGIASPQLAVPLSLLAGGATAMAGRTLLGNQPAGEAAAEVGAGALLGPLGIAGTGKAMTQAEKMLMKRRPDLMNVGDEAYQRAAASDLWKQNVDEGQITGYRIPEWTPPVNDPRAVLRNAYDQALRLGDVSEPRRAAQTYSIARKNRAEFEQAAEGVVGSPVDQVLAKSEAGQTILDSLNRADDMIKSQSNMQFGGVLAKLNDNAQSRGVVVQNIRTALDDMERAQGILPTSKSKPLDSELTNLIGRLRESLDAHSVQLRDVKTGQVGKRQGNLAYDLENFRREAGALLGKYNKQMASPNAPYVDARNIEVLSDLYHDVLTPSVGDFMSEANKQSWNQFKQVYRTYKTHQTNLRRELSDAATSKDAIMRILKDPAKYESLKYYMRQSGQQQLPTIRKALLQDVMHRSTAGKQTVPSSEKFAKNLAKLKTDIAPDAYRELFESELGQQQLREFQEVMNVAEVLYRYEPRIVSDAIQDQISRGSVSPWFALIIRRHFPKMAKLNEREQALSILERLGMAGASLTGRTGASELNLEYGTDAAAPNEPQEIRPEALLNDNPRPYARSR